MVPCDAVNSFVGFELMCFCLCCCLNLHPKMIFGMLFQSSRLPRGSPDRVDGLHCRRAKDCAAVSRKGAAAAAATVAADFFVARKI